MDRPWGFQEAEAPRFQDNRHMKVVRLSALRNGRLYHPGNIPGTHFCWRLSRPQGHSAAGRITSMKNVTPSGIEPATFLIVAQCLNRLRHRVPSCNDILRAQHKADHSPTCDTVVKNAWSLASFSAYAFAAWCLTKQRHRMKCECKRNGVGRWLGLILAVTRHMVQWPLFCEAFIALPLAV